MLARWPIRTLIAVEAGLTAIYFAADDPWVRAATWATIMLAGVMAIVLGVRRHRPARARSWYLVAAGAFLLGTGDTASLCLRALGAADPQPVAVDICYLGMFVLLTAGMLGLSRTGVPEQDRAGLLDVVTLTIAGGLLFWIYLIAPKMAPDANGIGVVEALNDIGYPIGMLLLVAMVVRLGAATYASPALALFSGGFYALAVGETAYLVASLTDAWQPGGPADLLWVLFYLGWGAAALHPSMTRLGAPRRNHGGVLTLQRFALLSLCALIPGLVLLNMAIRGRYHSIGVIGGAGLLMVLLVLGRLFGVLRRQWRALSRERALRAAGADLLGATDLAGVERVVHDIVQRLAGGVPQRTALVLSAWPEQVTQIPPLRAIPRTTLALPAAGAPPFPGSGALAHPAAAPHLAEYPLATGDGEDLGRLLVAGDRRTLTRLAGPLEILAGQTALAVTRIRLADAVTQREAEVYFQNLVYHSSDVILIVDETGVIRFRSPSAVPTFGDQTEVGKIITDLVPPAERARAADLMGRLARGDSSVPNDLEWPMSDGLGTPLIVAASWRDLRSDPLVGGFVITLRDVTEQRRLEDELTYRAYHDPLTGLPNREMFSLEADKAVHRTTAGGGITGVLFLDLDDFKQVNDTFGHVVGDQMLRAVAERLAAAVRLGDLAARLGGDEFAVLVPGARTVEQIEAVADRVVYSLNRPLALGSHIIDLSGSLGVATTADSDANALLRDADRALYQAKQDGKGRWRRHRPTVSAEAVRGTMIG
ncbi:GGDEF domain-containing protein [Hamadaea tsunoensis]|uniref:GGDEF domain-containing protein n=1 Tax=Hamadaea tsunoensis TaxID=53368 RepID=UPI0004125495|nr:GGDEF domain-containing protein [Hamadaea tsunoensis]